MKLICPNKCHSPTFDVNVLIKPFVWSVTVNADGEDCGLIGEVNEDRLHYDFDEAVRTQEIACSECGATATKK